MEVTITGFVLGLLLLALPVYIIVAFDLRLLRRFMASLARMACGVLALSVVCHFAILWDSLAVNILLGLLMAVGGAFLTMARANLPSWRMLVPVLAGTVAGVVLVGAYTLLLVLGWRTAGEARLMVPVAGLLAGCLVGLNARALHVYAMGLLHHDQLYYYLLGNGATHRLATRHFARRAFQAALLPVLRRMAGLVLVAPPVLMYAMVMSGVGVWSALALQVLLFVAVMAASVVSLWVAFALAHRFAFDEYERLKPKAAHGERKEDAAADGGNGVGQTPMGLEEPVQEL